MKTYYDTTEISKPRHKGNTFAFVLIIVGLVALASKLQVFSAPVASLIISWQMLLICIGLYHFIKSKSYFGLFVFFIGGFFIVPKIAALPHTFITDLPDNYVGTFWPIILIAIGVISFLHHKYPRKGYCGHFPHYHHGKKTDTFENNNGFIFKKSAFQSSEHIILDPEFKGGEVECSFGEVTIDLRKTQLQEGLSVLDIKCSFGAIKIYVPQHWYVSPEVNSVFGAFEDKRFGPAADANETKKLIIKGNISFGGCELRN